MNTTTTQNKLIHVAQIRSESGPLPSYLFLRKKDIANFTWFIEDQSGNEKETEVAAQTVDEALRLASRHWKRQNFRTVICGFRYTLPERDEHGLNALFHQMVASYSTMTGPYFDEDVGHLCVVHNASQEALNLWTRLRRDGKL